MTNDCKKLIKERINKIWITDKAVLRACIISWAFESLHFCIYSNKTHFPWCAVVYIFAPNLFVHFIPYTSYFEGFIQSWGALEANIVHIFPLDITFGLCCIHRESHTPDNRKSWQFLQVKGEVHTEVCSKECCYSDCEKQTRVFQQWYISFLFILSACVFVSQAHQNLCSTLKVLWIWRHWTWRQNILSSNSSLQNMLTWPQY